MIHARIQELLRKSATPYQVRVHAELPTPVRSPADFAQAIGYAPERIAKTLFLKDTAGRHVLVTLPAPWKIDFEKVAAAVASKRVQMGSPEDLAAQLGYPRHGVSPLGAGDMPVVLERSLLQHPTILIGGGVVGEEIEITPQALELLSRAIVADIGVPAS